MKKHISHKKMLLYCLDELKPKQADKTRMHLNACNQCREIFETNSKWVHFFKNNLNFELNENLDEHRLAVLRSIKTNAEKHNRTPFWKKWAIPEIQRPFFQPAFVTIVFAAGILLGIIVSNQQKAADQMRIDPLLAMQLAHPVSEFDIIPASGNKNVSIQFHSIGENSIEGKLSDPDIQYALAWALMNDTRDNIRLKSLALLNPSLPDELISRALNHAIKNDSNPGVRLKAIQLLAQQQAIKNNTDSFIYALLYDDNEGVRIEAALALIYLRNDPAVLAILEKQAVKDPFIKALMLKTENSAANFRSDASTRI